MKKNWQLVTTSLFLALNLALIQSSDGMEENNDDKNPSSHKKLKLDDTSSEEVRAGAELRFAEMDPLELGGPVDIRATLEGYRNIRANQNASVEDRASAERGLAALRQQITTALANNASSAQDRMRAQLSLAEMDCLGLGGPVNAKAALKVYLAIRKNKNASVEDRTTAERGLAIIRQRISAALANNAGSAQDRAFTMICWARMNRLGLGGPVSNKAALDGYRAAVAINKASDKIRTAAETELAEMRQQFVAALANNAASPEDIARARFRLADMDRIGLGGPVNTRAALEGFIAIRSNNNASDRIKASAELGLAKIRQQFEDALAKNAGSAQDRAFTMLSLAKMNRLGLGGPVNTKAALEGYRAALAINKASDKIRTAVQTEITKIRQQFSAVLANTAASDGDKANARQVLDVLHQSGFGEGSPVGGTK